MKIELPESFQVDTVVVKLPSFWTSYRKWILLCSNNFSLEHIQKHIRIEEESKARDNNDDSYVGTSKANVVTK